MPVKLTKIEQTQRTRRAILDRARQLFATKGYAATSTEETIGELGITRPAHHQFGDKLGVFKAVIAEAHSEITDYVHAKIQPLDDNWEREGKLNTIDAECFAHLVNGALNELATWVAQSNDPQRLKTAQQSIETLLARHQN